MNDRHVSLALAAIVAAGTIPALSRWLWRRDRSLRPGLSWPRLGAIVAMLFGVALFAPLYNLSKVEPALEPLGAFATVCIFVLLPAASIVGWLIAARSRYGAATGSLLTNYGVLLLWAGLAGFGHLSPPSPALPVLRLGFGSLWSLL